MAIRILFFGTSSFAVPILERLASDTRFQIVAVVTQPDRPSGRHATPTLSPIKLAAQKLGLPIRQYEQVKSQEALEDLQTVAADVAVVASFGQIIPQTILDLYPHGMVNVHGSVLPRYRGASPIAEAIKNGDAETGITIMKMDAKMDHGPILATATEKILPDDTTLSLEKRLAELGAKTLPDVLFEYVNGRIKSQEQDHAQTTTVKLLSREDGKLDWTGPADELERTIRAYDPWPGTFTIADGKRIKILRTAVGPRTELTPGKPFMSDKSPAVACGKHTSLILLRVQPEGKSPMDGEGFVRGHKGWTESVLT